MMRYPRTTAQSPSPRLADVVRGYEPPPLADGTPAAADD